MQASHSSSVFIRALAVSCAIGLAQASHGREPELVGPQGAPANRGDGQSPVPSRGVSTALFDKPIAEIGTDIALPKTDFQGQPLREPDSRVKTALPLVSLDDPRAIAMQEVSWAAPATCHRPLYFEEVNLERYGFSQFGYLQPVASAAHFFATVPLLPYKMTLDPPCECIYTLGHHRPGSCVPYRIHQLPLQLDAAAVEAGVVTGLVFLIP